jgi:hypothetical protein
MKKILKLAIIIFLLQSQLWGQNQITEANGNVGIGTTTPNQKLEVSGSNAGGEIAVRITNSSQVVNNVTKLEFADGGAYPVRGRIYTKIRSGGNSDMFFGTANTGGNVMTDRMVIQTDGNVGIGTTSPNHKLDVLGNIRSSGWIAAGGHPIITTGGTSGYGILLPSTTNDYVQIIGEHDGGDASNGVFITGDNMDDGWIFRQHDCCGAGSLDYAKMARNRMFYIGGNAGFGTLNPGAKVEVFNAGGGTGQQNILRLTADGDGLDRVDFEITPGGTTNSYWFAPRWGHNWHWDRGSSAGRVRQMALQDNGRLDLFNPTTAMNDVKIRLNPIGDSYFVGGNMGIGTTNPGQYKLAVEGNLGARKVIVTKASWADYVFEPIYKLPSLKEVEQFIKQNKHLPDVPSAKEVEKNGLDLGDNQAILLKKIEELTLYVIEQNKKLEEQQQTILQFEHRVKKLEKK